MNFVKMQGLGNDFIVVEAGSWDKADRYQPYAERWCHRQLGIGGDGLLVIGRDSQADAFMRIFNADGSEAMMCGNGMRCVGRYAYEKGWVPGPGLSVRTPSGIKYSLVELEDGQVKQIRVDMGEPVMDPGLIPVIGQAGHRDLTVATSQGSFTATPVSMGNPHCVIFVDRVADIPIALCGAEIETNPAFPDRTNVEFVEVVSQSELIIRVWERGCGITLACGTGACAAAVAAVLNQRTGRRVQVHLLGGDLLIEWDIGDNHVYMTGPATHVFSGAINL